MVSHQPTESPTSPSNMSAHSMRSALIGVSVAAIIAVCVVLYKFWPIASPSDVQQKIVVLDVRKLLAASTRQIMDDKSLSTEQAAVVSTKLAQNMQKLIQEYRAQGYLVFNGSSLLTWPAETDITANFAEQLGVKIE